MSANSVIKLINGVLTFAPVSVPPQMGNVCLVDAVNGSDFTGVRGGLPFLTPAAALAAAASGDVVWILPGVYTLSSGLTVPSGVGVSGLNHGKVILQMLSVSVDTTLFTMGESSIVENITLKLTSAGHHALTGVLFPGTTAATSSIEGVDVIVDNSGASDGGTSNVYGVHSTGNGSDSMVDAVREGSVTVHSAGLGSKRGVLVDTAAATFSCRNVVTNVMRFGSASGANYIGAEVNFSGANLYYRIGNISGPDGSDISQTLGTLTIGLINMVNHTANGNGFTTVANPMQMDWGDNGAVASGTRYMYRGTATASSGVMPKTRLAQKACATNLTVRAAVGPGASRTDTWTIQINGVDTALTASLTASATSVVVSSISVTSQAGDDISLKMVCAASSTTSDVQVTCNFV